jgi:hypothetical protein
VSGLIEVCFVIDVVYFLQYSLYSRLLEFIRVISVSQLGFYTHKSCASGINKAKCMPQRFSNIKNISRICKPIKRRNQTLRCILYCAFHVAYLVTCAVVEHQMPFIMIVVFV